MRRTEFKTFDLRSNANCEFPSENIQNQTIDSNIHQRVLSEDINRERTLISERNFEDMVKSGIDVKMNYSYVISGNLRANRHYTNLNTLHKNSKPINKTLNTLL